MTLPHLSLLPPPHPPCVRPKNVSVCRFKTFLCVPTSRPHVVTHVRVVPVHTGTVWIYTRRFFSACHTTHQTPPHTTNTHHTHTAHAQHTTPTQHTNPHAHTPQHTETDRQTKWTEAERRERRWKTRDNTKDKMKDEEDEKTRRKKRQEKIKRDTMCYVCGCVLCSEITRPSNNFEFSKLSLPTLKEFNFLGNFVFVRLQVKIVFKNYLGNHFGSHGTKSKEKTHQDHIAHRGQVSMSHCNMVHKPIPIPTAMQIGTDTTAEDACLGRVRSDH